MPKEIKPINLPVRFFLWKDGPDENGEDQYDIFEVGEGEWQDSNYPISYERNSIYNNGVAQILLIKMPKH